MVKGFVSIKKRSIGRLIATKLGREGSGNVKVGCVYIMCVRV